MTAVLSPRSVTVRKQSVVIFGDSITGQNDVTSGGYTAPSPQGYWTWANIRLGQRFSLLANAGVSSDTTALMLARIASDVLSYRPGWCVVQGGGNDLGSVSAATTIANLESIYSILRGSDITVVATTLLPGTSIQSYPAKAAQINDAIRSYALAHDGVVLCDWGGAVAKADGTGVADTGMTHDSVHPSNKGAMLLGRILADQLDYVSSPAPLTPYFADDGTVGILADPLLNNAYTIGRFTGSTDPTYSQSTVARTDGINGNWRQYVVTACTDGWRLRQDDTNVGTKWNVGDAVRGLIEFEVDSGVAAVQAAHTFFGCAVLQCLDSGGSDVSGGSQTMPRKGTGAATTEVANGVFLTDALTIPATTTRLRLSFESGYTGTFRLGRMQIVKA